MRSTLQVLTAPVYEPLSLAQARAWARVEVDDSNHDTTLNILRSAMREDAENLTFRAYIPRQYRLTSDDWPQDCEYGSKIELPFPPLISVDAFRYIDADGVLTTLATDQYAVHDEYEPAFIIPAWEVTWPTIRRVPNALQIDFTAGYAPGSPDDETGYQDALPEKLKQWMQAKMLTLFDNRAQFVEGRIVQAIPRDFTDGLLDSLIVGTRLF